MFTSLPDQPNPARDRAASGPLRRLFVDFNSFFASVEQQLRPELRGLPIGVIPVAAKGTCCIAASYEAKRHGVKTGTSLVEARQLCPAIRFVHARPAEYVKMHEKLVAAVESCLPVEAVLSIDEMCCALPVDQRHWEAAQQLAIRIKQRIRTVAGEHLTCSIGIAGNTFLAKTASDMQKPDGLVILLPEDLPEALHPLELADLCGIGRRMEARLRACGIETVEELCASSKERLRAAWGGIEGERFHARLHGAEIATAPSRQQTLGHSHVLPPELRNGAGARAVLHRLTQKAGVRLRADGLVAGRLLVHARWLGGGSWSMDRKFTPTADTAYFIKVLSEVWDHTRPLDRRPLAVGMTLLDLVPSGQEPVSLFGETQRSEALNAAIDRVNQRFGRHAVYFAGASGALDHAPMRIAFNRIPDLETEE